MKRVSAILSVVVLLAGVQTARAQAARPATQPATRPAERAEEAVFGRAAARVQEQLDESVRELAELYDRMAKEKLPLTEELGKLQSELQMVRARHREVTREYDLGVLTETNLKTQIKEREDTADYLSNLLTEYVRNLESRLHISEIQRYEELLEKAKNAPGDPNLTQEQKYRIQIELVNASLGRLEEALGATRFKGEAVDAGGLVRKGDIVLVGPAAVFRSEDGRTVGAVETRLGSPQPAVVPFGNPQDEAAAGKLVAGGEGRFPLDPTLGNAHKIESTEETLWQHIKKGGPLMVFEVNYGSGADGPEVLHLPGPILLLGAAAMLVALYKWISLAFLRRTSQAKIGTLLNAVADRDESAARKQVKDIKGPVGDMLRAGVEHLRHPRELIEEVMYEKVLSTRLKLQRLLPFVALSASSAPLLGLLGTVTGIISTFKLITVYGSGDVKTLSGGISEALITTEFGLIVAIPSLLLYAFLSRKARGTVDQMEKTAVAFVNQVSKTPFIETAEAAVVASPAPPAPPAPAAQEQEQPPVEDRKNGPDKESSKES
jgi:biopolymer transport protein ExbB